MNVRTITLTLGAAGLSLAAACSSGGPPPDAVQVLKSDGYTQMAVPGYTVADGHHISPAQAGDGLTSQAVGVSTSNPNLYQVVMVYAPGTLNGVNPAQPGGMWGGNRPGVTIAKQGDAVVITGTLAALKI